MIITSYPFGIACLWSRKNSLINRFTRFRLTEFPTLLLTVMPNLVISPPFGLVITVKFSVRNLLPWRLMSMKSALLRIRSFFVRDDDLISRHYRIIFIERGLNPRSLSKTNHAAGYTASLFRPLALLLLRTFLPPLVLILSRKPWTRDLFMLLGWNVRFMEKHFPPTWNNSFY